MFVSSYNTYIQTNDSQKTEKVRLDKQLTLLVQNFYKTLCHQILKVQIYQ